jgi:putative Mn2+ efflux pump MntP
VNIFALLLLATGLAMDCFAIALGISCSGKRVSRSRALRVAAAFGFAQAAMPVIGWLAGRGFVNIISGYDHWVIFGLLFLVGAHMIWESFHEEQEGEKLDLTHGWALVSLALLTSIDALATGIALAFENTNILAAALTIGAVTFLIVILGFFIGDKVGERLGRWAGTLGGLILIGIGSQVLLEHLLG